MWHPQCKRLYSTRRLSYVSEILVRRSPGLPDLFLRPCIYGRVARALEQTLRCTGAPSASGKRLRKRLRATSPAWCQCSSCSTYVGVSGDGMQEPPKESDASVSTLISLFLSLLVLFYITCTVYFMKYRFERAGAVFKRGYGYWVKIY